MSIAIADGSQSPPPPVLSERRAVLNFKFRATAKHVSYMPNVGENGHHGIIKKLDWPGWRCKQGALQLPELDADWQVSMVEAEDSLYERIDDADLRELHWIGAENTTVGQEARLRLQTHALGISAIPRIIYEQGWFDDSPRIMASLPRGVIGQKRSASALRTEPRPTRAAARTGSAIVTALTAAMSRKRKNDALSGSAALASKQHRREANQEEMKDFDETSEESRQLPHSESAYKRTSFGGFEPGARVEWTRQVQSSKQEVLKEESDQVKMYTVRGTIVGLTSNGYRTVIADGETETHAYRPRTLQIVTGESERTAKRQRQAAERTYAQLSSHQNTTSARSHPSTAKEGSRPRSPRISQTHSSTMAASPKSDTPKNGMRVRVVNLQLADGSDALGYIEYSACGYRWVRLDGEARAKPYRMHRLEILSNDSTSTGPKPMIAATMNVQDESIKYKPASRKAVSNTHTSRLSTPLNSRSQSSVRSRTKREYDITSLASGSRVEIIPTDGARRRARGTIRRVSGNGCRFVVLDGDTKETPFRPWQLEVIESAMPIVDPSESLRLERTQRKTSASPGPAMTTSIQGGTLNTFLNSQDRARLSKEDLAAIHNTLTVGSRVVIDYNPFKAGGVAQFASGTVDRITHGFRYVKIDGQTYTEAIRPSRLTLLSDIPPSAILNKSSSCKRSLATASSTRANEIASNNVTSGRRHVPQIGQRVLVVVRKQDGTELAREGIFQGPRNVTSRFRYVVLDGEKVPKGFLDEEVRMLPAASLELPPAFAPSPASALRVSASPQVSSTSSSEIGAACTQDQFHKFIKGARVRASHSGVVRGVGTIERVVRGYRYVLIDGEKEALCYRPSELELLSDLGEKNDSISSLSLSKRARKASVEDTRRKQDFQMPPPIRKRRKKKSERFSGPLPLSPAFYLGRRVYARWARDDGIYLATITALHPDSGAVDLEYEDGDYWDRAPVAMVVECLD